MRGSRGSRRSIRSDIVKKVGWISLQVTSYQLLTISFFFDFSPLILIFVVLI